MKTNSSLFSQPHFCIATVWALSMFFLTPEASAQRRTTAVPTPPPVVSPPAAPVKLFVLETATVEDIQEALSTGALTSVELVTMFLRRIQAYDRSSAISPSAPLNSVADLNPDLLADAAESDRLRKLGTVLGPFHGIPFLVKGSFPIKGMPLSGGTNAWNDFIVTSKEAWVITKLRAGGAIVMGYANMDTWANSATSATSQRRGTVRSCYLAGALPGGSSGGSGVATGAYLSHFTFGGETGGSIRNPGDRNNSVGFKVSGGSISVTGIIPLSPERDVIGPITRTTLDNAYVRDAVGEIDPADPWNPILPIMTTRRPVPESGFVTAVKSSTLAGKKIGIIGTHIGLPYPTTLPGTGNNSSTTVATTTALVRAQVEAARADMIAMGATVETVFMPRSVSSTFDRNVPGVFVAPVSRLLNTPFSNEFAAFIYRSVIEDALYDPADSYSARAVKVLARAEQVPTFISATRRNLMYTLVEDVYSPGPVIDFASAAGVEHSQNRAASAIAFEDWMDAENLDAVVWPNWANKTATGGTIIARDQVNFVHLPAVTVPAGILQYSATPTNREGITLNFSGRYNDDVKVLAIASAYERGTKKRYSPPLAPALPGEAFAVNRQSIKPALGETVPPVLTIDSTALVVGLDPDRNITFSGNVADSSGIARLEVSVGGVRLPASIVGSSWSALLSTSATSAVFLRSAASLEVLVLAVDHAGNSTCQTLVVPTPAPPSV
jgi:amidase